MQPVLGGTWKSALSGLGLTFDGTQGLIQPLRSENQGQTASAAPRI